MSQQVRGIFAVLALVGFVTSGIVFAGDSLRLRAKLRAPSDFGDVSGHAKYRERDNGRRRFSAEIEGMIPGDRFEVVVDGVTVGVVTVDSFGVGELELDTNLEPGDDEGPLPGGFPGLRGGELVEIGPLSGTLERKR